MTFISPPSLSAMSFKRRKAAFSVYTLLVICASFFAVIQHISFRRDVLDSAQSEETLKCNNPKKVSGSHTHNSIRWNHTVRREHPHAGAQDENGTWPYVPNVEAIRRSVLSRIPSDNANLHRHYPPLDANSTVCQEEPGQGFEGPHGYKVLREYVELDGPNPLPIEQASIDEPWRYTREGHLQRHRTGPKPPLRDGRTPPRILCGVYTHEGRHDKLADIADTWGWRCDGFYAASTKTDRAIGAVDLPHQGTEEYGNMWQKTRSMMAFMYDYYLEDFDYFLLCGDDTFVILENLRNYLLLLESETDGRDAQPLFIGCAISHGGTHYNIGGPGYLLNKSALIRLVEQGLPYFFTNNTMSSEDGIMGRMMSVLHVHMIDTSDAANRQRFFHDSLEELGSESHIWLEDYLMYDHGKRKGRDFISTQSVSFHKIASMHRFRAILYNSCPVGTVLGDAQESAIDAAPATELEQAS
jgi:hypothetical protein